MLSTSNAAVLGVNRAWIEWKQMIAFLYAPESITGNNAIRMEGPDSEQVTIMSLPQEHKKTPIRSNESEFESESQTGTKINERRIR